MRKGEKSSKNAAINAAYIIKSICDELLSFVNTKKCKITIMKSPKANI
jgi:hypothetical protein